MRATPKNNATSTLRAPHSIGSTTLLLKVGTGARFGTPTPSSPAVVTVYRRSTLRGGAVDPDLPTVLTIFSCTGRAGDDLTGATAIEGTTDQTYSANDPVIATVTEGFLTEIVDELDAKAVDDEVVKLTTNQTKVGRLSVQAPDGSTDALQGLDPTGSIVHKVLPDGLVSINTKRSWSECIRLENQGDGGTNSTLPWSMVYGGNPTPGSGRRNHIISMGWHPETTPNDYAVWTYNTELQYAPTYPTDLGMLEWHWNYYNAGRTRTYRPKGGYVNLNTDDYLEEWHAKSFSIYAPDWQGGTMAAFSVNTKAAASGNSGKVVLANDGTSNILEILSYTPITYLAGGNLVFNSISNAEFQLNAENPASAGFPTKSSPITRWSGTYWDGATAQDASVTMQCEVISGSGSPVYAANFMGGRLRLLNSGRLALGVAASLASQNIVMGVGYFGVTNNANNATHRAFGLNGSDQFSFDPDARGSVFGGAVRVVDSLAVGTATGSTGTAGNLVFGRGSAGVPDVYGAAVYLQNQRADANGTTLIALDKGAAAASAAVAFLQAGVQQFQLGTIGSTALALFDAIWGTMPVSASLGCPNGTLTLAPTVATFGVNLAATGTLTVGGGAAIQKPLKATATLDFASIAAGAIGTQTVSVTGAVGGEAIFLGPPAAIEAGLEWCGAVTAADTVTIRLHNTTGGAIDPASGTWTVWVIK